MVMYQCNKRPNPHTLTHYHSLEHNLTYQWSTAHCHTPTCSPPGSAVSASQWWAAGAGASARAVEGWSRRTPSAAPRWAASMRGWSLLQPWLVGDVVGASWWLVECEHPLACLWPFVQQTKRNGHVHTFVFFSKDDQMALQCGGAHHTSIFYECGDWIAAYIRWR